MFPSIAKVLGTPASILYTDSDEDEVDIRTICSSPPIFVIGPRAQGKLTDGLSDSALRFALGRSCEIARPERIIACGLPFAEFSRFVDSIVRVYGGPKLQTKQNVQDQNRDQALRTALPVKLRRHVEELMREVDDLEMLDPERYISACNRAADRAGLIVSGDIVAAHQYLTQSGASDRRIRNLLETPLQPGFLKGNVPPRTPQDLNHKKLSVPVRSSPNTPV